MIRVALAILGMVALAGCPAPIPRPQRPQPIQSGETPRPGAPVITWQRVQTLADVPAKPEPGTFQIHMIDVGTGLAILVRGADFNFLFDAGTNDAEEKPMRILAYLAATLGPSGDELCVPEGTEAPGTRLPLPTVVLSHPHFDHASALDLVVHCYQVGTFYDSGAINQAAFYRDLVTALEQSPETAYRTAADVPSDHHVSVKGYTATIAHWESFRDGDVIPLGEAAQATILHADGKQKQDMNENSIVLAVQLGATKLLLVGDAESGPRKDPTYPVGDIEEMLLDEHKDQIHADILQVGHHGSMTSSRAEFVRAVGPVIALVSAGPKKYGRVTLPDHEVLEELAREKITVLRTDEHDGDCPVSGRIGGDRGPGGCDSWVITIKPGPAVPSPAP